MSRTSAEALDERIWQMHSFGVALSKIAAMLDVSVERARRAVTGRWYEDKQSARRGRK